MRKFLSVLLSLAMLMSMLVVPVAAEDEASGTSGAASAECHLLAGISAYEVMEGETVTVTLHSEAMTVKTFSGGLSFDSDALTCIGISTGSGYDRMADGALMTQLSTTWEANANGNVGLSVVRTAEETYDAQELLTVTFTAAAPAESGTYIGVYEDSDGMDGFAGEGAGLTLYIRTGGMPHEHVYDQQVPDDMFCLVSAATCEAPAVYYWSCICGEPGTETFTYGDALGHTLMVTPARQPSTEEPGNSTYWTCGRCGKYFSDAAGTVEIEEGSWVIPPLEVGDAFTAYLEPSAGQVCPGQEFTVTAKVRNAPKFAGFQLLIKYDADRLEPVKNGSRYTDQEGSILSAALTDNVTAAGLYVTYIAETDVEASEGTLFTFKFKVKDSAPAGKADITVETDVEFDGVWTSSEGDLTDPAYENTSVGVGHVYNTVWSMNADSHWFACGNCGQQQPGTLETHDFSAVRDNGDGTHNSFCTICGYTEESAEEHYCSDGWQSDGTDHWKVCDACGAVYESESHSLSCVDNGDGSHNEACNICGYVASTASHSSTAGWAWSASGHWKVCDGCGAEFDRDTHKIDYADNGNGTHSRMCDVCGYVEETATHSSAVWHENGDIHWKVCDDCGVSFNAAAHALGYVANSSNNHSLVCSICGYVAATGAHTDTGSWISAEAVHWKECSDCKAVFAKAVHSFAYQANTDGTHSYMCGVCGYVKETAAHSSDAWQTDGTDHWKVCDDCGTEFARGAHKATGEHAATCVAAAVCDVCALRYGEADAENHDYVYGAVTPATPTADGEIQKECSRCHTITSEPLTYHASDFNMSIGKAVVHRGTITVPVSVANNPGISGLKVTVQYDKTKLELVGATAADGVLGIWDKTEDNIAWAGTDAVKADGELFYLEFNVLDSSAASNVEIKLTYQYDNVLDENDEALLFGVTPGEVKITAPGDIDGDGRVRLKDVRLLLRYVNAMGTSVAVEIVPGSADVDNDGRDRLKDVRLLLRYVNALGTSAESEIVIY